MKSKTKKNKTTHTPERILEIYTKRKNGESFRDIEREFNLIRSTAQKSYKTFYKYLEGNFPKKKFENYLEALQLFKVQQEEETVTEQNGQLYREKIRELGLEQPITEEQQALNIVISAIKNYARILYTKERGEMQLQIIELEEKIHKIEEKNDLV